MASHSTTMSYARRPAAEIRTQQPLPWPVAALTIGTLSAGLWLGIGWAVVSIF